MQFFLPLNLVDLEFEAPSRFLKSLCGQTKAVFPPKKTTNVLYITYLINYVNILVIREKMLLVRFTKSLYNQTQPNQT